MFSKRTLIECIGCGVSFDLRNRAERKLYKKHDCETFDVFCDNYGTKPDCDCPSCRENKANECEHPDLKHTDSSAHLAFCPDCDLEFRCECEEWNG